MRRRKDFIDLFLVSAIGLFTELVFIRWVASELRIFAFYKNFALIATFLGLGLGFAAFRRNTTFKWFEKYFFPLLIVNVGMVLIIGRSVISEFALSNQSNAQEFVWAPVLSDPVTFVFQSIAFYAILLSVFILITFLFIPLGYITVKKFKIFPPLRGYSINVSGSLVGILLYTLISFLRWPPSAWFLIAGVGAFYFLPLYGALKSWVMNGILMLLIVLITMIQPPDAERTLWSPYYRIDLNSIYAEQPSDLLLGYGLVVNKAWHQMIWNLSADFVAENYDLSPDHFDARYGVYDLPYLILPTLDNVLIVGAGSGNDVAGAIRAGAQRITAVEIDPLILDIGKELHPEEPYADSDNLTLVNQDARSFFRNDENSYDLIVFGLLDSHTLFSTASSVRLDNFVYTIESFTDVKRILAEDGLLVISFGVPAENEWIGLRLYRGLKDVFGHEPQTYQTVYGSILLILGHQPFPDLLVDDSRVTYRDDYYYDESIEANTDQWPYLYLRDRSLPTTYLIALISIAAFSIVFIRRVLPDFRQISSHFFFMGAAFFLLETKSITEIALLLGSTWIVNAAVIAAILTMILIANILVERFKIHDVRPFYTLLVVALIFNYFVSIGNFLGFSLIWRITLASLSQAIPLFFAGIIFAITFKQTKMVEVALGSNLIGAVLGGIFEYSSLMFGIRSLYLLALAFYIFSAWAYFRFGKQTHPITNM